jgi:CRISPR/Cas system-associated exonuclease Cas4 (RecB family)
MFLRCPLQFQFHYLDGINPPVDGALVLGKSVHHALEANGRFKIDSRTDMPTDDVCGIHAQAFDDAMKSEEVLFAEGDDAAKLKDIGVSCIREYFLQIAPKVQPVMVEKHFMLTFENVPYSLQGYIDVINDNSYIRDNKVIKRAYSANAADDDLQLTTYNLAYKCMTGKDPRGVAFDIMTKTKQPKALTIESGPRTEAQLNRLLKLIGHVSTAMKSGIFFPVENPITCSWCSYKAHCNNW